MHRWPTGPFLGNEAALKRKTTGLVQSQWQGREGEGVGSRGEEREVSTLTCNSSFSGMKFLDSCEWKAAWQEGTEGRDTVDLCRARLTASVLCSLKHVPEKSYKVSEALGTEAGLLRPTQEAHISVSSYTRTCKAVFSGTVHHHARQSRCWGLLAKPSDATTV